MFPNGFSIPILGVYEILDSNFGMPIDTLIFMSNPEGIDPPALHDWADTDPRWTDSIKA